MFEMEESQDKVSVYNNLEPYLQNSHLGMCWEENAPKFRRTCSPLLDRPVTLRLLPHLNGIRA